METTTKLPTVDICEVDRAILRQSLNKIANELEVRLREASLSYPIFIAVPNSGQGLMTMLTPLDPPDGDWSRITEIVHEIIFTRNRIKNFFHQFLLFIHLYPGKTKVSCFIFHDLIYKINRLKS